MRFINRCSDRLIQLVIANGHDTLGDGGDLVWNNIRDQHWETLARCGVYDLDDFNRVVRLMGEGKLLASDIDRIMNAVPPEEHLYNPEIELRHFMVELDNDVPLW